MHILTMNFPTVPTQRPESDEELLSRALSLAGFSLGELASIANWQVPKTLTHAKGWAGQLIELFLGASAGSKQEQDFPHLGIELKTVPIDPRGLPLETTYVCIAPLLNLNGVAWEQSNVRNKLQRVLWIPIDGRREISPSARIVGTPMLWSPNTQEDALLQQDWEELTDMIVLGNVEAISAKIGMAMQIRPKAANGSVLTDAIGPHGALIKTRPRGYYLKKEFTSAVFKRMLGVQHEGE